MSAQLQALNSPPRIKKGQATEPWQQWVGWQRGAMAHIGTPWIPVPPLCHPCALSCANHCGALHTIINTAAAESDVSRAR